MAPRRRDKTERRFLNADEASAMGFTEMQEASDDEGWPYPDDANEYGETTENVDPNTIIF